MSQEYIVNGAFDTSLDGWLDSPSPAHGQFVWDSGKAKAESPDDEALYYMMYQKFTIPGPADSALFDVWYQYEIPTHGGAYAEFKVYLKKPSGDQPTLWTRRLDTPGAAGSEYALQGEDILEHIDEVGVYSLMLCCEVAPDNYGLHTKGWYDNLSLLATVQKEKLLSDTLAFAEHFVAEKTVPGEYTDQLSLTEHFTVQRLRGLSLQEERLLAGKTNKKMYDFSTGIPLGILVTDELDFGRPGEEKTLDEIVLISDAESPHTVAVYYSTDAKVTWNYVGVARLQRGRPQFLYPRATAEAFHLKFRGYGLYLVSWVAYAEPRGRARPA